MYENGEGVSRDFVEALKWYRLAAEQGHPGACDKVALFFDSGMGVATNKAEAMHWFKRAVNGGFTQAEVDLARLGAKLCSSSSESEAHPPPSAPTASTGRSPNTRDKASSFQPKGHVANRSSARSNPKAQVRSDASRRNLTLNS